MIGDGRSMVSSSLVEGPSWAARTERYTSLAAGLGRRRVSTQLTPLDVTPLDVVEQPHLLRAGPAVGVLPNKLPLRRSAVISALSIKSLVVELSDGKTYQAAYRPRPPVATRAALGLTGPIDYFWSAAWLIPQDYPTGSLSYRVVATDMQGNTQEWTPMKDLRSLPVVIPGDVEYTK
jgi:hypothetical protein